MESDQASNIAVLSSQYVFWLAIIAIIGLSFCWGAFWWAATRRGENIRGILASPAFFRTVTVMGVIAVTGVLSLAGHLSGNTVGAILSGIVGYVLGQMSARSRTQNGSEDSEHSK